MVKMKKIYNVIAIIAVQMLLVQQVFAQCPINIDSFSKKDACFGDTNGRATITVSGGSSSTYYFELQQFTGSGFTTINSDLSTLTTYSFNNVPPGNNYRILILNGACAGINTSLFSISTAALPLSGSINSITPSCSSNNGAIDLNVSGGTAPYSYAWTGPTAIGNIQDPTGLAPGTYGVTVTDALECIQTISNINIPGPPSAINQTPPAICADVPGGTQATGIDLTALNASIDGGNGYTINWYADAGPASPIAVATNVTVNDGDDFFAEVIDGNGCSAVATVTYSVVSAPVAPANFQADSPVCDGFELSWDASATALTYRVEIDDDATFATPEVNTTQAGTTYTASGLNGGITYYFRITPINTCGDGVAVGGDVITTTVPDALSNLILSNAVCDGFDLSWDVSTGADNYHIEIAEDNGFATVVLDVIQAGTTYSAAGLNQGMTYYYRVTPVNNCGDGVADSGDVTTLDITPAPLNPVSSAETCDGFTTAWEAVAGADSYLVEVSTDGFTSMVATATPVTNTVNISGLAINTAYAWRVTAINSCGSSVPSVTQNATTTDVPAQPTGLLTSAEVCDGFQAAWTAASGAASYLVEVSDDNFATIVATATPVAGTETATFTGLAQGTLYKWRVTAINSCGNSIVSAEQDATTTTIPAALANLQINNIVCDGFELSWDASAGASGYRIEISEHAGFATHVVNTTQAGETYMANSLTIGTEYFYRVTPINNCGDGVADGGNVTTTDVPDALTGLASSNEVCDGFELNWTASTGADNYQIEVADDPGFTNIVVDVTQPGIAYTATGLGLGTTYYYRVTPLNTCGEGTAENGDATTTDVPEDLTGLTSSNEVCEGFDLNWTASVGADNYHIEIADDAGFTNIVIDVTQADILGTAYTASGLNQGTQYFYRITPINSCGDGIAATGDVTTTDVTLAPVNPVSSGEVCDEFIAGWDAVADADSYEVEVSVDGFATILYTASPLAGTETATFGGLNQATTYSWRVRAINACGESAWTDHTATTTTVPDALADLQSFDAVCEGFELSWAASDGADNYRIEIADDALFTNIVIDVTQADITYTASSLSQGTQYFYRVTPVNNCGDGIADAGDITTLDITPAPMSPVSSAETCDGFTTAWAAVAGADSYLVEVSTDGFGTILTTASTTTNTIAISGLAINTTYEWRVTAINSCGSSVPSVTQNATTTDVPEALTGLASSTVVCDAFSINWNVTVGASDYRVEIDTDPGFGGATTQLTGGTNSFTFTGLALGTTYHYRVTPINSCGEGTAAFDNATTTTVPEALTGLAASNEACNGFDLNWNVSAGANDYRIEIADDAGFANIVIDETQAGVTYTASGLLLGTTYYYRVTPLNTCGEGTAESEDATTLDVTLAPTSQASSAETCDSFTAHWDAVPGIIGYEVQVSTDNFATTVATASPAAGTEIATFSGLSEGENYSWRVRAINNCGESAWSAVQTATTSTRPAVNSISRELCSDVIGGNSTTGVNLVTYQAAMDGNTNQTFAWFTNPAMTNSVADPLDVTVTNGNTFYARIGDAPCTSLASLTFTVNPLQDAAFTYAGPYCQYGTNPTPTVSGTLGGTFTAPMGLNINAATGEINLSTSIPNTYTITYTTPGPCPATSTFDVTINPANDPAFSYANPTICQDADPQSPDVATNGGAFSALPAGLAIDALTGEIDAAASAPNTYTVTYAFGGACPTSTTFDVTITNAPDATFSYAGSPYCRMGSVSPQFPPGASGGTFTAPAGLVMNTSGVIDLANSAPGNYTVTNTIAASGTCDEAIQTYDIEILPTDNPAFSYSQSAYCKDEPTNPVAILDASATTGGIFSSTAGLVFADTGTGEIDLTASTAGGPYIITYNTLGDCPSSTTFEVTINEADNPAFTYNQPSYCKDEPTNPVAILDAGATTGGEFTSATAQFVNPFTGEINLATTPVGTHRITYTTTGVCNRSSFVDIDIIAVPTVNHLTPVVCEDAEDTGTTTVDLTALQAAINGGAGLSFTWYNDAGLAPADEIATPSNYTVSNGIYYAVVSNGTCQSVATVNYTVRSWPALTSLTRDVCETTAGSGTATVSLSALQSSIDGGAGLSFSWYTDAAMTIPVSSGSIVVSNGDDFFARATDGSCSNTASVTFTVNTLPTVSFSGLSSPYCETDGPVSLSGSPGNGTFTGPGINNTGPGTATFNPAVAGPGTHNIIYSFTNASGCTAQSSDNVTVNDCTLPVTANFDTQGGITSICEGQTITFRNQSSGAITDYTWDFGAGASPAIAIGPGPHTITYTGVGLKTVFLEVSDGVNPDDTETKTNYITVNPADDSGFSYASTDFCPGDANPTPITVNTPGGTFTASPAGLVIDADGNIDLDISIPGSYMVRYTTAGTCPTFTEVPININPAEDPSFTYASNTFCQSDLVNPTANITGDAGGTFSSTAGLVIDDETGEIDLAASTAGDYEITYTTSGACPVSTTFDITINPAPDATFSYASHTFCQTAGDQAPVVSQGGGNFIAPVGLAINPSSGVIDPLNSAIGGPYIVTYEIDNGCVDTETFEVYITGAPDAYFYYDDGTEDQLSSFCQQDASPTLVFGAGATPGTFSSNGLALTSDGSIDLANSAPGTYTVTNTITSVGSCANATHFVLVEVREQDDASFSYAAPSFCKNETVNPLPAVTGTTHGIFASSDPALVINANTGEIDLAASMVGGPYTITYTTQGNCFDSQSVQVSITDTEDASFNYGGATTFCNTGVSPVPFTAVPGGTFSADPAIVFTGINPGEIDLAASTVGGPYTITYTTPGTTLNSCEGSSTMTITIFAEPSVAVAGPDAASCEYAYTLDAEAPVTGTGMWTVVSTPTGTEIISFSNANDPASTVNVSDFGSYEFRWTVTNGSCSSSDVVQVEFYEPVDFYFGGMAEATCDPANPNGARLINPTSLSGGINSYSYSWVNSSGDAFDNDIVLNNMAPWPGPGPAPAAPGVPGGIYIVTVKHNVTGCERSKATHVSNNVIDASVSIIGTSSSCNVSGTGNGQIDISYAGTGPYRVAVHFEDGTLVEPATDINTVGPLMPGMAIIDSLAGGTYYVDVQDIGLGCSTGRPITLTEADPLEIDNVVVSAASCFGVADGSIMMDVSGGTGPYTFRWKENATDTEVSTDEDPSGLVAGTYYVEVTDNTGCMYTSEDFIITEPAPAMAPVADAATAVGCNTFTINWSNESVLEYDVEVSELEDFSGAVVTYNITDGSTSLTINTGLSASTTYHYRVRAHKSCDWTAFSTAASVSTTAPPVPVAIAASSVFCDAFTANWNSVTGALGYEIDVATTSTFDPLTFVPGYEDRTVPGNSVSVSGLTVGNTYYYRVKAETACGWSIVDSDVITVPLSGGPGTPADFEADAAVCDGFDVNWSTVAGAASYRIEVSEQSDFSSSINKSVPATADATMSTSISDLTAGTEYHYRVVAVNFCGEDATASEQFSTAALPEAVATISPVEIGCTSLEVSWVAATDATGYIVELNTTNDFTIPMESRLVDEFTREYDFPTTGTLTQGTEYWIRVIPTNSCGNGAETVTSFTTRDVPEAPALQPVTNIACDGFTLAWDAVDSANEYDVQISEDITFTTGVTQQTVMTESAVFSGLSQGRLYHWRVLSRNDCGESASWSATGDVNTDDVPDVAPALQPVTGITCDALTVNWDDVATANNYRVELDDDALFGSIDENILTGGDLFATFADLSPNTTYYFRVTPINDCGDGLAVAQGSAATSDISAAPANPVSNNVVCDSFTANWEVVPGATGYVVEVLDEFATTTLLTLPASTNELGIDGLESNTPYTWRVWAEHGTCGISNPTADQPVTTAGPLAATTTLNISAPTCNGFTATWSAVTGAAQYRVEVSSNDFTDTESYIVDATELSYEFTTLTSSVFNYEVRVVAIDACGNDGTVSTEVAAQTSPEADCGCGFEKARFVVSSENVNCPGSEDGALMIYVNPTATTTPTRFEYRYESEQISIDWTNGGGFPGLVFLADELPAGEYTVSIRDKNAEEGCEEIRTFTRTIRVQNGATLTTSPETCTGSDGKITVSIPSTCLSGQTYEVIGRNADTDEFVAFNGTTAENLVAGSYEIILRNDLGDELEVLTASVITTCSNGGGGGPGIICELGNKTVDVAVTPANCETGEGSVIFTVIGGETDTYNFRVMGLSGAIDQTKTGVGSVIFDNLPADEYDYMVIDDSGSPRCESTFRVVENIVVLNTVSYTLPACDAPEQTATLDVLISAATNAPAPYDVYVISGSDTVSRAVIDAGTNSTQVTDVPTGGEYNVVVRSRGAQTCPASRIINIPATGNVAISFDYTSTDIVCFGDGGTVTVNNIVVAENTEFTINLMKPEQTQPYASRLFSATPSSYTFGNLEKGDYRIQIVQQQTTCGLITTESSPTFTINGASKELTAVVPEVVHVTVNAPYGTIRVDSIQGGGLPYEVRIAADPKGGTGDWIRVSNSNPVINTYAHEFRDLEMGRYFVEVRDKFGCSLLYEVDIRYTEELYIPNIITPNGDGDNDTFRIINLELGGDEGARMVISNRWGKIVYRSDNYTNGKAWDGGEQADGVYFYELIMPSGSKYAGWIEIWRGRTP